jgi:adenylate cyclase
MRLSPRDFWNYGIFQTLALAYIVDGDAATACDWAQRAVRLGPNYLPGWTTLAASAAATGRDTEARIAAEHVLALNPAFSIRKRIQETGAHEILAPYFEGMRRAGLPE